MERKRRIQYSGKVLYLSPGHNNNLWAMPWLRQLVSGLPLRRLGPRPVCAEFIVDYWTGVGFSLR